MFDSGIIVIIAIIMAILMGVQAVYFLLIWTYDIGGVTGKMRAKNIFGYIALFMIFFVIFISIGLYFLYLALGMGFYILMDAAMIIIMLFIIYVAPIITCIGLFAHIWRLVKTIKGKRFQIET